VFPGTLYKGNTYHICIVNYVLPVATKTPARREPANRLVHQSITASKKMNGELNTATAVFLVDVCLFTHNTILQFSEEYNVRIEKAESKGGPKKIHVQGNA
jgi:hypothetical protein